MNLGNYVGRHAEWYDLFYGEKPYRDEAFFVDSCFQKFGSSSGNKRVLELACGTGQHALSLEQRGYDIVAIDSSPDMLARAREKASKTGSKIDFQVQDMCRLELGGRKFSGAYSLFDSIGYVETNEAVESIFSGLSHYLEPGSIFIFEFWHAAAMLRHHDRVRTRRWQLPSNQGEIFRVAETSLDFERCTASVAYTIYELRADNSYFRHIETQTGRYFHILEMTQLLRSTGFAPLKWYDGFREEERITDRTWHVVAVTQKI